MAFKMKGFSGFKQKTTVVPKSGENRKFHLGEKASGPDIPTPPGMEEFDSERIIVEKPEDDKKVLKQKKFPSTKDYTKRKMRHLGAMAGLEGEIHRVKTELEKGKTPPTKQGFIWNDKIKKDFERLDPVWEPAYEGGDHSFEDLSKMSKKDIKTNWPDESKSIIKDVRKWKRGQRKNKK